MRKLLSFSGVLVCLSAVLLVACRLIPVRDKGGVMPTYTPTPNSPPTSIPQPHYGTPVLFEALAPYPTPEGLTEKADLAPAQTLPPGVVVPQATEYPVGHPGHFPYLVAQKQVGRYSVGEWQFPWTGSGVLTISADDEILVKVESFRLRVRHAGRDITGEGHPDVVIDTWSAGSYVSWSTKVYDLGPTLTQVLDAPDVLTDPTFYVPCPWDGRFSDLDGDGSPEFITCDDAPESEYWSASSTNPYAENRNLVILAVLDYQPGQGYMPAGHRFPELYTANIDRYTGQAEQEALGLPDAEASSYHRALVALTMNYLYSGQPAKAWAEFDRLYNGADKVFLWSWIVRVATDSPFYLPAGAFPDVPVPDYYSVRLHPGCASSLDCPDDPDQGKPTCTPEEWLSQQFARMGAGRVVILREGQKATDPAAPERSLAWLEGELRDAGLLLDGEVVWVSRPDDGTRCRVDIVRLEDDVVQGVIELDQSGGFPGTIRRVGLDGKPVASWRLRGDLTWEEVPVR